MDYLRIKPILDEVLQLDDYAGNDGYMVYSVYFDSLFDKDLYDTIDGLLEKRKIRLRRYGSEIGVGKLEYKCKTGSDSKKYSLLVSRTEMEQMLQGNYDFLCNRPEEIARTMYLQLLRGGYMPKTVVKYQRNAYQYPASDVRITFDSEVYASPFIENFFEEEASYIPITTIEEGILEVKYNDFLPSTLKNIIESLDVIQCANSKYAQARIKL